MTPSAEGSTRRAEITMLTSMAHRGDFCRALDRFRGWQLGVLDIKDHVWGKNLIDLTDKEAERAACEIDKRDLRTYCLSSTLFHQPVEGGEAVFRDHAGTQLDRILELARLLRPKYVRLLSANLAARDDVEHSVSYVCDKYPWLVDCYKEAIDKIEAAGFDATVENEARNNMFSTVDEVLDFFGMLDTRKVCFTWDIQNLWTMGTFPNTDVFDRLKRIIGYVHFKGGKTNDNGNDGPLHWRSPLKEASWPVADVCSAVVESNVSPVLCLNRSHGMAPNGYDREQEVLHDLEYLKQLVGVAK